MRATLTEILALGAARHPSAPAASDATGTLDWRGFCGHVEGLAACLAGAGVTRCSRVALWLPNSIDYLALIFACARLGALAVHVNTRFRAAEIGALLSRAQPCVLVTAWDFPPVDFAAILASVETTRRDSLRLVIARDLPPGVSEFAGLPAARLRPAGSVADAAMPGLPCLTYTTSGTTSGPKLVLHRQQSIASHAIDVMHHLRLDAPGAALLAAVPLCGTFGNAAAMAAVAGGAHAVCLERFDPAAADALIRRHRITHLVGGDDMMGRLAEAADRPHDSVRLFGFAAFHPTAQASIAAAERAGLAPHGLYGSSEVQALFAAAMAENRLLPGGQPACPAAAISIRDPLSGEEAPHGVSGEICIRAPSLFDCYLNDPDATARAMTPDGFFRTGDVGRRTQQGFVFEARLGDTLRLGGFMVHPDEIESFLQSLPGVAAAQVVGVEHDGVLVPVAFLRARPGERVDAAGVIAACRESLARYKVPRHVEIVEAFPTTDSPNGIKIQRVRLREMADALLRETVPAASAVI